MNKYFIILTALIAIGVANATTGTLISGVQLPLVMDGKTVGSMTLQAGTKVTIEQVLPNNEGVMVSKPGQAPFKVATSALSPESLMAATPVPTPTPTKVAETPTNAPAMATRAPAASTPSRPPPTKGSMEVEKLVQEAYDDLAITQTQAPALKSLKKFADIAQISIRESNGTLPEKPDITAKLQDALNKLERVSLAYTTPEYKALQGTVKSIKEAVEFSQPPITITINNTPVKINRFGKGPIGVIFFNHSGHGEDSMDTNIIQHLSTYYKILNHYTFFIWSYPDTTPFNQVDIALHTRGKHVDFSGIATSVINEIEKQSQLKQFLLVGDSLGSGIILWDYKTLKLRPQLKFLLISPTEIFSPANLEDITSNTVLVSTSDDPFVKDPSMKAWSEKNRTASSITGVEASGHIIIGNDVTLGLNLPHSKLRDLIQLTEKQN